MQSSVLALGVVAVYFLAVLVAGSIANRLQRSTREDFFLASRSFGTLLLFLSVLGTNLSAFAMLGAPGAVYRMGIGLYHVVAGGLSITFPLLFFFLGYRIWLVGKKYGYLTPVELLIDRFQSPAVGIVVFLIMVIYTVPYVVIGQIGSGLALSGASQGAIPYWAGSLLVTVVVGFYVSRGGMRGTAFTNAVQVVTFIAFLAVALFAVPLAFGGADALGQRLLEERPNLLHRSAIPQMSPIAMLLQVFTFTAAFMSFPQVFVRMLTARSGTVIKRMSIFYPLGFFVTYVPVVALGLWGAITIPGLVGNEPDNIIMLMMSNFMPSLLAGFALAALFAMIMSTMDAQVLAISSFFSIDIVQQFWPAQDSSDQRDVRLGRLFTVAVLAVGFLISLIRINSVFFIANLAFTGFGVLFPVLIGTFYSRRLNRQGVLAGLVVGSILAPLSYFKVINLGPLPSLPVVAIETLVMAAVSALTPAQPEAAQKFLNLFEQVFKGRDSAAPASEQAGQEIISPS